MFGRLKPEKSGLKSIDGMTGSRAGESGAVVLDAEVLPWKNEAGAGGVAKANDEETKAELYQKRIINFFTATQRVVVTPEEIVGLDSRGLRELKRNRANVLRKEALIAQEQQVEPEQKQSFLKSLARGEITAEDEANFLLLIPGPLSETEVGEMAMFDEIMADPRQTQILAVAAGLNASNWQKVDRAAMRRILENVQVNGDDYRTPVGFMELEVHFLRGIRPKAKEQVYRRYEQSMKALERTLYGERLEYYRQFEKLRDEAKGRMSTAREAKRGIVISQPLEKRKLRRISTERSAEMLGRAMIDGDAWKGGGAERMLSTHDLTEAKLGPMYEIEVDGVPIYLSTLFQIPNGDVAAIGYVVVNDGVRVRGYYQQGGQGVWKYLPDYIRGNDGRLERYLEGVAKESVILPMELLEYLAEIEVEDGVRVLASDGIALDAEFYLAGTAYAYDSLQDYQSAWTYGRVRGDYYREVGSEPIAGSFELDRAGRKKAPYTLSIDRGRTPDFSRVVMKFELETADAGEAQAEVFDGYDGQYRWMFARDKKGRVWVEHVEVVSPVTSTGLRRDFAVMGDFVTALYEPTAKAGIYGDRNDTKGARQCMWKNYLSNVPMIQEYLKK